MVPQRDRRALVIILLVVLVVACLLAVWLVATGLGWVLAVLGLIVLIIIAVEGWWKP